MGTPLVVIGGGGFAREILDVIDAINSDQSAFGGARWDVVGVVADPAPDAALLEPWGVDYLGGVAELDRLAAGVQYVIGIGLGGGAARRRIDEHARRDGRCSATLVHPSVTMGRNVTLGPGTVICSHVSIAGNVTTGRHVHVGANTPIGHDTRLEDYSTVSPLTAVSGNVTVGAEATVGTGAAIRERLTVGAGAFVAAGAVVVRNVNPGATVKGVPAR